MWCISAPKSWSHIKNTVVLVILTFCHIHRLQLMYAEIFWVLVSLGIQVQPQVRLDPDYLPDCLSSSYDYERQVLILSPKYFGRILLSREGFKCLNDLKRNNAFSAFQSHLICHLLKLAEKVLLKKHRFPYFILVATW